jgi:peptidyl-prolyl cis-trans isomerase D
VSPVQSIGNKKYIVALVTGGKDKGNPQFSQVKKDVEAEYMREAKAEVIMEKIKNAKTLAEVATAYSVSPQAAPGVSFVQPVLNGAYEPAVGGVLYNLKANEVSKAIKGYSGIVMVQPTRIGDVKVEGADLTMIKMQAIQRAKSKQGILESLSRNADIKDNRIKILN